VRRRGTTRVTRISLLHLTGLAHGLLCVNGATKPNGLAAWPAPFASVDAATCKVANPQAPRPGSGQWSPYDGALDPAESCVTSDE
jgi:hypothetical protein